MQRNFFYFIIIVHNSWVIKKHDERTMKPHSIIVNNAGSGV
jgi:hypothetical protein